MRALPRLVAALAVSFACASAQTGLAYADSVLILPHVTAPTSQIEELTLRYEEALAFADDKGWEETLARAKEKRLDEQIAEKEQKADKAARYLFELQNNGYQAIEMLLRADSLEEFIKMSEYLDSVTERSLSELNKTIEERAELEAKKERLEESQEELRERLYEAESALREAQDSRSARQYAGISACLAQDPSASGVADGANWYATEGEFVAEWAPRIDAYLAGSPMAGLGRAFAQASWRYCVDPRWSPAIAHIESSKGRFCVRSYNAWGWGAADVDPVGLAWEWSSWESAIDTHVRGLSDGYGYTITLANAQKYCSSWEKWYVVTLGQMSMI